MATIRWRYNIWTMLAVVVLGIELLVVPFRAGRTCEASAGGTRELSLSEEELAGLVQCLQHCTKVNWIGQPKSSSVLLKYIIDSKPEDQDRPGVTVFVALLGDVTPGHTSGQFFVLKWDSKRCGRFLVGNDAHFNQKGEKWVMTSLPLGGLWTQRWMKVNLENVRKLGREVRVTLEPKAKRCGTWSTYFPE